MLPGETLHSRKNPDYGHRFGPQFTATLPHPREYPEQTPADEGSHMVQLALQSPRQFVRTRQGNFPGGFDDSVLDLELDRRKAVESILSLLSTNKEALSFK